MHRRSVSSQFNKSCRCLMHDTWGDENPVLKIDTAKKFKKSVIELLRTKNLLTARANYLCDSCYKTFYEKYDFGKTVTAENIVVEETTDNIEDHELSGILTKLITLLKTKGFTNLYKNHEQQWLTIMRLVGFGLQRSTYMMMILNIFLTLMYLNLSENEIKFWLSFFVVFPD